MTDQGTRNEAASGPGGAHPGAVTAVAAGALGTAANLDETQVFSTEDLQRHAAEAQSTDARSGAAQAVPAPAPSLPPAAPTPQRVSAAPVGPIVAVRSIRSASSARGGPGPFAGLAGVLGIVLVVLAGLAFMTTRGDGLNGTGGASPQASTPIAAPSTENPGGKGNGKDHSKDKGGGGNDH